MASTSNNCIQQEGEIASKDRGSNGRSGSGSGRGRGSDNNNNNNNNIREVDEAYMNFSYRDQHEKVTRNHYSAGSSASIEELLSTELLNLSFQQRTDNQEEIHGVKCLAIDETTCHPEFVNESLRQLHQELNSLPDNIKRAYIRSQQLNSLVNNNSTSNNNNQEAQEGNINTAEIKGGHNKECCYINSKEFRLRFLRCELFNIPKAAIRMVNWLDAVLHSFGEYALEREIKITDFTKNELRRMKSSG